MFQETERHGTSAMTNREWLFTLSDEKLANVIVENCLQIETLNVSSIKIDFYLSYPKSPSFKKKVSVKFPLNGLFDLKYNL